VNGVSGGEAGEDAQRDGESATHCPRF
jgi:hypothetical protein